MILHKFTTSPFASNTVSDALGVIASEDSVILIQDAVYLCLSQDLLEKLANAANHIYFIQDDLDARGLLLKTAQASAIDYHQFVSLVIEHHSVMSW